MISLYFESTSSTSKKRFFKAKCFKSDSQQERKINQKYTTNDKVQIIREKNKNESEARDESQQQETLKWQN